MFRRSSLSSRGSVTVNRGSIHLNTVPSQPRYVRDKNGLLKYVVEVDLRGVPREDLKVNTRQNIVIINAKYDISSNDGDKCTHEVVREIHVPLNVDLKTVRCTYSENGFLTIEAEATDPLPPGINRVSRRHSRPNPPPRTNYQHDPRRVTFMEPANSDMYSDEKFRQMLTPMRHLISPPPSHFRPQTHPSTKRLSVQTRGQSVDPSFVHNSNAGTSPSLLPRNSDQVRKFGYHSSYQPTLPSPASPQLPRVFRLRVEIGSHIDPTELNITRQNGLLVVQAKRYVRSKVLGRHRDRLVFEHRSEHTLPNDVDVERLSARLENGTVYVDAPYLSATRPTLIGSPKTRQWDSNVSDGSSNWYNTRPR